MSLTDRVNFRTRVLTRHLNNHQNPTTELLQTAVCVCYSPPELSEPPFSFDTKSLRKLLHGQNIAEIDNVFNPMMRSNLFCPRERGGKHATHTVAFSQLEINGVNHGVHAFIAQIRDSDGNICPNVRIADCGHKIGLNGVDSGRIWFDNLRIPRENLLNSVADVSPDGQYLSAIKDPDQRFGAFMAPLTTSRIPIAVVAMNATKVLQTTHYQT
ncbi:unnamed protein product [Lactuca saligna]|uniref:Uncharacterized protein n=1 Tax=Lactuca saligna TaxID=75948 RepID=A0AA35VLD0_LACSI|nr:unnamed protein product [Lactuca saligna]